MPEGPWSTTWDFSKDAVCFNCHKNAAQHVEINRTETSVTCTNCGAERHYTIHGFFVADKKPGFDSEGKPRKYDVWKFTRNAKCVNCLAQADQEVVLDEYKGTIVCPACLFTRVYRFNMFNVPKKA